MLYNIVLVSAVQRSKSTLCMYIHIPPSWISPLPCHHAISPLGHHRAPSWAPRIIQQVPTNYLFYTRSHIYTPPLLSQFISSLLPTSPCPHVCFLCLCLYSVQFSRSVMSDSLWPHKPQHARPPGPSPTPGVHPNPCPLCRWCHPTISSSVVPFSSFPQSFPASGSFQMSQLSASGGQSSVSTTALQTSSLYHFSRFHIYALIYSISFFLSDLLHRVWQSLSPSTSLQMIQLHSFSWLNNISLYYIFFICSALLLLNHTGSSCVPAGLKNIPLQSVTRAELTLPLDGLMSPVTGSRGLSHVWFSCAWSLLSRILKQAALPQGVGRFSHINIYTHTCIHLGENGYMDMCGWIPSLFTWNYPNIVDQLYPNTK